MNINLMTRKNKEINKVILLPLMLIDPNPNQPRRVFEDTGLQELCNSIAMNGLLQPVTVRRIENGRFELIAGERRMLAYKVLGKPDIPAIVEEYTESQSAMLALVENLQRKDLSYFEEAYAILRLMNETKLSQQDISAQLGMAQSTVANKLRLLKLPDSVQKKLFKANLTERHARALLKIDDEKTLLNVVDLIIERNYNVQQTEKYISDLLLKKEKTKKKNKLFIVKDIRIFLNSINKAISIMNKAGIQAEAGERETEEYFEYIIRVPKYRMYRNKDSKVSV